MVVPSSVTMRPNCTTLDARKLSVSVFIARRYTPTVGVGVSEYTSSATRESTWSATKSLRVRLASTISSIRFWGTSR